MAFDLFDLVETTESAPGVYTKGKLFKVIIPEGDDTIGRKGYALCVPMKTLKEPASRESIEIPLKHLAEPGRQLLTAALEETKKPHLAAIEQATKAIQMIERASEFFSLTKKEKFERAVKQIKEIIADE